MKNIMQLVKFNLRNRKKYILGWCLGIFVMMFIYMILFPSMKELGQAKMDALPKSMLELMGVESFGIMTNWVGYFGMIFNIFAVVISFFTVTFAGSQIYSEEKTKSIEFMNSLPVSRSEVYWSKVISSFVAVLFLSLASALSAIMCGLINGGETFILVDVLQIIKITGFIPFFFMALALCAGGITTKLSPATVGSASVILFYMISYLGSLLEDKGEWLRTITPFKQFSPANALALSNGTMLALGIFGLILVAFLLVGNSVYNKRDFNI